MSSSFNGKVVAPPASSSGGLRQWCADALHNLLGFSDAALASYLVSVARKAKSSSEIVQVLQEGGTGGDVASSSSCDASQIRQFADQLWRSAHASNKMTTTKTKTTALSMRTSSGMTNADWVKAASRYELLAEDDDHDNNDHNQKGVKNTASQQGKSTSSSSSRRNGNDEKSKSSSRKK